MARVKVELSSVEYELVKRFRELKPREKITIVKQSQNKRIAALVHKQSIEPIYNADDERES